MELGDLPDEMQEVFHALRHGSYTIECDIGDALEGARNVQEFGESVKGKMRDLMNEARQVIDDFCGEEDVVFTIRLKGGQCSEALEELEDEIRDLLEVRGINAQIEDGGSGNTTVAHGGEGHGDV